MPAEDPPGSGTTRVLDVEVTQERADDVVAALRTLIDRVPEHAALLPLVAAGVEDGRPFYATRFTDGEPLDGALARYGPAAIDDALPRAQALAEGLDFAAEHGYWHGALEPRDILVSADETQLRGIGVSQALASVAVDLPAHPRYAAPEVLTGEASSPAADQFALALVVHEWMFGRAPLPFGGPLVPSLPNLDVAAMQRAFDTATSHDPAARFSNCSSFIRALRPSAASASMIFAEMPAAGPELPLHLADAAGADSGIESAASPIPFSTPPAPPVVSRDALSAQSEPAASHRFGVGALAAALVAGIAIGAIAMRLLPRDAAERGAQEVTGTTAGSPAAAAPPSEVIDVPVTPPRDDGSAPQGAPDGRPAPAAANPEGRRPPLPGKNEPAPAVSADAALLVRSVPAGATVTVDGATRGTTPVAVRGLDLGVRHVVVSRPGYEPFERQITLTAERRSRTLEVELTPAATRPSSGTTPTDQATSGAGASGAATSGAATSGAVPGGAVSSEPKSRATPSRPGPSASPQTAGAPALRVGTLVIESRPSGASVTVDGRPAGVTPLTLTDVAAGRRTVRLEHAGYRTVTTTVDVRPGERARVAARLEGGMDEE